MSAFGVKSPGRFGAQMRKPHYLGERASTRTLQYSLGKAPLSTPELKLNFKYYGFIM